MAYLDDRERLNGRIALMTIPAVAFFVLWAVQSFSNEDSSATLDELATYINPLIWISPIFVIIQVAKMISGTAARSWQNMLCAVVTAAAAALLWRTMM